MFRRISSASVSVRKDFRKADQLFRLAVSLDAPSSSSLSSTSTTSSYWGQRYSSFLQSLQKRNALQWLLANQLPALAIAAPSNDDDDDDHDHDHDADNYSNENDDDADVDEAVVGDKKSNNNNNDNNHKKHHHHHRRKSSGDGNKNRTDANDEHSKHDDDDDELPFAPVSMIVARTVRDVLVANRRAPTPSSIASATTTTSTNNNTNNNNSELRINAADLQTTLQVIKSIFSIIYICHH
jgi:hypothetical protein